MIFMSGHIRIFHSFLLEQTAAPLRMRTHTNAFRLRMALFDGFSVEKTVLVGYQDGRCSKGNQEGWITWVAVIDQSLFVLLVELDEDWAVGKGQRTGEAAFHPNNQL